MSTKIEIQFPKDDAPPQSSLWATTITGSPCVGDILKFDGDKHRFVVTLREWSMNGNDTNLRLIVTRQQP